ncbi:glycosyltransferase family protein [Salinibacillus xinjiangensis]|uniref:Glycosyltransferase n=1 Tax=Salinibacillus xinjiangensis TaxID=1229268 RepID=A0A6G1X2B0_9BACI|nr:glycosyltransferase [Salinibacillus xinjiangensis]MRG85082.1 glycosyltransferase [Salinibacillus xinjiangensis]
MDQEASLDTVLKRIDQLQAQIDKINKDNPLISMRKKEEILSQLLDERKKLKQDIILSKYNEQELLERIKKYEKLVERALSDREKNINYLQNRVTVLEQSFPLYVSKRLKIGVSQPKHLPKELFNVSKAVGGAFKRKLTKKKRKYNKVKLPFAMGEVPKVSDQFILDREKLINKKANELFLMGLYNNPQKLKELRVAAILDDFSYQAFKYDANLITFRPDNWFEILKTELPHMLLVESAWKGNSGSWQYKIAKYNIDQGSELDEMLKWCKQNNIPTVFWNKEDPIHFDRFINTASKFDYIYTSDANLIEQYKEVTGNDNVYSLSFAAQPVLHNPVKVPNYKENNISFAGSYYANRHEQRRIEQENLLEVSKKYGLVIFDRNYNANNVNPHMQYPEKFSNHIQGSLPYEELVKVYKQFKIFLNVNSVKDSPTMFSRRVYELLACGTSVVSTDSVGINQLFGDFVTQIHGNDDVEDKIGSVINDENLRNRNEIKGMRTVFDEHTYAHRLYKIATNAGFTIEKPYKFDVAIIGKVYSSEELEGIKNSFFNQNYNSKHLLVLNYMDEKHSNEEDITYINISEETDNLKATVDGFIAKYDLIGTMNPNNHYGKYYLSDLINAYKYSKADTVGKAAYYSVENNNLKENNKQSEYTYTTSLLGDAYLMKTDNLKEFNVSITDMIEGTIDLSTLNSYGMRLFSTDIYNFVKNSVTNIPKNEVDI